MHVLLVEDDDLVASGLEAGLALNDFTVDWVRDGRSAMHILDTARSDAVILDLGLPDSDGLSLLEHWRRQGVDVPVLILTARDALEDRVAGLEAGADDYVLKPFELDELVARLRALLRRAGGRASPEIVHGDLVLNPTTRKLTVAGRPVHLSRRELALLEKLLSARGAVLSEDQLKDGLYGMHTDIGSNALNVHLHHLRRKLGKNVVETVRGVGYRLGPPVRAEKESS